MEKRLLLTLALSLIVLLVFQKFYVKPAPRTPVTSSVQEGQEEKAAGAGFTVQGTPAPGRQEKSSFPSEEKETEVRTEEMAMTFSDIGGALTKIALSESGTGREEKEETLIFAETPESRPFLMRSPVVPGLDTAKYKAQQGAGYLEYVFEEPGVVRITKKYTFHKPFNYIDLEIAIKNLSSRRLPFSYTLTGPAGMQRSSKIAGRSFLESDIMIDGKVWKARSVKGAQERAGDISWVALKNRYFTMMLKPLGQPGSVVLTEAPGKNLTTSIHSQRHDIVPGGVTRDEYLVYAGPLDEERLAALGHDMQAIVDYGFFGGVSKILLKVLRFFHTVVRNWGVAIILLTLAVNLLLFPLTIKSFISMQQMKKLQPHMQKLKELHKDNPQKLNKEMMELYKTYNVNPLGGCLPLILQMPIFIALYQGLVRSVELKGAHFLWIKDLAKPDAVPLPFSLPFLGNTINILPLLMVGMMVLQQKISQGAAGAAATDDQASQQKMMMVMFPLLFGFLFYNMPSGLVLYWLTNTILMTGEQTIVGKRLSHT